MSLPGLSFFCGQTVTMKNIAIIPARGGSKGISGKNICEVNGKPLIAFSIEAALQAMFVDRVVVSTDDKAIADVSIQYGAEVIQRPADISGDLASSESALLHVLDVLDKKENYRPELLVFLQCTSPLTLPGDIDGTIEALLENGADTAFAAAPFHYYVWSQGVGGDMIGINHDKKNRLMRQQRQDQFIETGAVYVMRVPGFIEKEG